jgi:Flp pilus assembly pilin Flp
MAPIAGAPRGRVSVVGWGLRATMVHPSRGPTQRGSGSRRAANARRKGVGVHLIFERLWRDRRGASLIDYAILVALITSLIIAGVALASSWVQSMWTRLLGMLG